MPNAGESKKLGAGPCERLMVRMPNVCECHGCYIRRAVAVQRVGMDFPAVGANIVAALVAGA